MLKRQMLWVGYSTAAPLISETLKGPRPVYFIFPGTKGGLTISLSAQFDEYLPLVYNNHWGAGIALQLSYSGVAELGQWTILNPGKRTSVTMSVTQTTVRTQDRMFLNPFALVDPQVRINWYLASN
jgi:hypothetical protein